MSLTMEEKNAMLRHAVEQRREAQAAGKPHEAWYGAPVAETLPERHIAADMAHDATRLEVSDVEWDRLADEPYIKQRLRGDGIQHEQQPGSLPFLELLEELRTLHLSKSQDYGSESDPLANIRQGAEFVGIEPWRACMVRIADKVQRLKTYCRTGRLVHEGVRDTLMDCAAYCLLSAVLFDEGRDA